VIYGFPGQNLAFGDTFRVTFDPATFGPFTVGRKIKSAIGAAAKQAWIRETNQTLGFLTCVSIRGTFVAGDTFSQYTAVPTGVDVGSDDGAANGAPTAGVTALSVSLYLSGRGQVNIGSGLAVDTGYTPLAAQGYDLSDVTRWSIVGAASGTIIFDRGADPISYTTDDPTMALISGLRIVSPAYNFRDNIIGPAASPVTLIITISMDTVYDFSTPTPLATIVNGSPTDGPGAFGYGQLFSEFSVAATERFIRVEFAASASLVFEVGNIWLGAATDSIGDEGWNFADGFNIQNIDRGRYTDLEGGGFARTNRNPYRRYDVQEKFNRKSWDKIMDAVEGRMVDLVDDPSHPWAFALDPDNKARLVTGQHALSGLFRVDGSPQARDNGVRDATGVYFIPDVPLSLREFR